jgi:hypothetical protein
MDERAMDSDGGLWFVALLRFVCFVDDARETENMQDEVVVILRALDRDAAFLRVLDLGRGQEHEYLNQEGAIVQWRFERVLKLRGFSTDALDGAEVLSSLSRRTFLPFDTKFEPQADLPDEDITWP